MKGGAEAYGHARKKDSEREAQAVGAEYAHSEQEGDARKGMPIMVHRGHRTKTVMPTAAPNKGIVPYSVGGGEEDDRAVKGARTAVLRSDHDPAILVLMDAVRE